MMKHYSMTEIMNVVAPLFQSGLISEGNRGEFIARIIQVMAYDRAISSQSTLQQVQNDVQNGVQNGVPVESYLNALLGDQAVEGLKNKYLHTNSVDEADRRRIIWDEMMSGTLRFSQLIPVTYKITESDLIQGYNRHNSFLTKNNASGIDMISAVSLKNQRISAMQWSIKNYQSTDMNEFENASIALSAGTSGWAKFIAKEPGIMVEDVDVPYLLMYMNVHPTEQGEVDLLPFAEKEVVSEKKNEKQITTKYLPSPLQIGIGIRGLSPDTFPMLAEDLELYSILSRLAMTRHPVDDFYDFRKAKDRQAYDIIKQMISIGIKGK
jgi:hypothetical protein